MRIIKIFLASSEELTDDRNAFGNLVRRLDKIYEKRGIRIELFEWEDYDAAFNNRRKQDEYNDQIKASDMFLALFHTKAGKFTIEEFDVATEEFKKHASPKVYTYCKDLQEGEQESPELVEFKRRLFEELGHYWCRYNNRDSMQLHFVMQLQLVETSGLVEELKLEEGTVTFEGMPIAKIDNLQFAAGNEAYQKMSAELASLPEKIEKARMRVEKFPEDDDLLDDLQQKLNRYNKLKNDFSLFQQNLFETAKRITSIQQEQVSDMLRRAIDAFEEGNLERANTLLDEIAHEADSHMEQLEQQRALIHLDIDVFQLQAKTVMADVVIPIDERISKTTGIYSKADEWANKSALPDEKYEMLLENYGTFLSLYGLYEKSLSINRRLISIREKIYGPEHPKIATSYNNIGIVYEDLSDYEKSLIFHGKSLQICEKQLGHDHPNTATSYNNIGHVYYALGNYRRALENYFKALEIREKIFGLGHPSTANSYGSIGTVYDRLGDYKKALEYQFKALKIHEEILGNEHDFTATSYNSIGIIYKIIGDFNKALEYLYKALKIREKVLGYQHPSTATLYNDIGVTYRCIGDYEKTLEFYFKTLSIYEKGVGIEHPFTATSYNNIGGVYYCLGDYEKALEFYSKSVESFEIIFGLNHPSTATLYHNIGGVYSCQGSCDKALEFYGKALAVKEKILGVEHTSTALSYNDIGNVYDHLGDFEKALEFYSKAFTVYKQVYGLSHADTEAVKENIDRIKLKIK